MRKIYSFRAITQKLKAVGEAESHGLHQLAMDVANGKIHFEVVGLRDFVKISEMRCPLLIEFAKMAKGMRNAIENTGSVTSFY